MLVNLCTALAYGLVQPWIPKTPAREVAPPPSPKGRGEKDQSPRKAKSVTSHTSAKTRSLTVDPDGLEDIKKALEVGQELHSKLKLFFLDYSLGQGALDV